MPRCVRAFIPGGPFFFTVALLERRLGLSTENIDVLRNTFAEVRGKRSFAVRAIVVLLHHLYCIWTLPDGDSDFSTRWHSIKRRFSRAFPPGG